MRPRTRTVLLITAFLAGWAVSAVAGPAVVSWKQLQAGMELASMPAQAGLPGTAGTVYVVRVAPQTAKFRVGLASEGNLAPQTAAQWCRSSKLALAINLGMFQSDHRSNVGYLRHGRHINNPRWNAYRSVLAINGSQKPGPLLLWLDLDQPGHRPDLSGYETVVQNLRLIAANGRNVWSWSARRWSEAALAMDSQGRLLFIFCRAPFSMREFNELLLALPLNVTRAMHLEGGPEASLSVHVPGFDLDLSGSFETGFLPDESNQDQWPIPNVLGVAREDSHP